MIGFIKGFRRYFVLICIAFIAGIYFAESTRFPLFLVLFIIFCIFIAVFSITAADIVFSILSVKAKGLRIRIGFFKRRGIIKAFCVTAVCTIAFAGGFLRMDRASAVQNGKAELLDGKSYFSKILVTSPPVLNSKRTSVSFGCRLISYTYQGKLYETDSDNINILLLCTYPGALNLNTGDVIETYCDFSVPEQAEDCDDLDYCIYLRQKEISVTAFSKYVRLCSEPYDYRVKDKYIILGDRIRKSICKATDRHFGFSSDYSALLKSILTGDRSSMPEPLKDAMSKSGISHISAVSGMHISILFSAVSLILGVFRFKREIILIIMIPLLAVFMTAASFSPSVMRAAIMLLLFITANLIGKDNDPVTSLFAAAFIILCENPYTLLNASFIFSFGSSLSILIFSSLIKNELVWISKIPFIGSFAANSLAATIAGFMGTAYFSVYFFGYAVLSGLIVNLWIVPFVPVLFCGGYTIWILEFAHFAHVTALIKYFLTPFIEAVLRTAYFFKEFPVLYPYLKLPGRLQFVIYILILIFIYSVLKFKKDCRPKNR